MTTDHLKLGSCCGCRTERHVVAIIFLPHKCPMPGRGWGCFTCNLPSDGAQAVLCGDCTRRLEAGEPWQDVIRWACRGYPATDGRVLVVELVGTHEHDMSMHEDEE